MGSDITPNSCSPSTTAVWKYAKIQVPPEALRDSRPQAVLPSLSVSQLREPLTVTFSYRGGPEAWWQADARGRLWRAPGWVCVHDLMTWVHEGRGGRPRSSL